MTPYDEQKVVDFINKAASLYSKAGQPVTPLAGIWISRFQFTAVSDGYEAASAKHLDDLARDLGLSQPEPQPEPEKEDKWQIIQRVWDATSLTATPATDADADYNQNFLLDIMVDRLRVNGYQTFRHRNPSGTISNDKIEIDGAWYDIFQSGYAGHAPTLIIPAEARTDALNPVVD